MQLPWGAAQLQLPSWPGFLSAGVSVAYSRLSWPAGFLSVAGGPVPYKEAYLIFAVAVAILHSIIDVLQLQALKRPAPPKELQNKFKDPDLYRKTQLYSIDKWCAAQQPPRT